jgi:hypothetical protein
MSDAVIGWIREVMPDYPSRDPVGHPFCLVVR